ncbi:MAG: hypothetical protein ABWK05_01445 [Pyrobaculum sp.]
MPVIRTYYDESDEPVARIVEDEGVYVVSMDVFAEVKSPPEGAEAVHISDRYVVWVRRRPLGGGWCEFVYFQFPGGVQLINVKYVGPDDPEAAVAMLRQAFQEEVAQHKKEEGDGH